MSIGIVITRKTWCFLILSLNYKSLDECTLQLETSFVRHENPLTLPIDRKIVIYNLYELLLITKLEYLN